MLVCYCFVFNACGVIPIDVVSLCAASCLVVCVLFDAVVPGVLVWPIPPSLVEPRAVELWLTQSDIDVIVVSA